VISLRICLAGAATVLALGGGTALAAPALVGSVSHGDSVSAAAGSCSKGVHSDHGACVSAVAEQETTHSTSGRSSAEGSSDSKSGSNDAHGDAVSAAAKSCAHGTASDRDFHGECVSAVARSQASHAAGH